MMIFWSDSIRDNVAKKDNYFLYGKEFEITLFIQGEKDEAPTNIQKEAYISFINKK